MITIVCDASHCPDTLTATFAFMVIGEFNVVAKTGVFKKKLKTIHIAEASCIINALHYFAKLKGDKKVLIYSDSLSAKNLLTKENQNEYGKLFRKMKEDNKIFCKVKYIKGHKLPVNDVQAAHNWCDRACRKLLNYERNKTKQKQQTK